MSEHPKIPEPDEGYLRKLRDIFDVVNDPELRDFHKGYIESGCWKGETPITFGEWLVSQVSREAVRETSKSYEQGYEDGYTAAGGYLEGPNDQSLKTRLRGLIAFFIVGAVTNACSFFALHLLIRTFTEDQSLLLGTVWFGLLLILLIATFVIWFKAIRWFIVGVDDARQAIKAKVVPSDRDGKG